MASKNIKEEVTKACWSGFISLNADSSMKAQNRLELFKNMQEVAAIHNSTVNGGDASWRKTVGDSLIYLQENVSPQELLNLMVLENYIDQATYVTASKTLGVNKADAIEAYKKLALIQEA